jgi:hypothetical protein
MHIGECGYLCALRAIGARGEFSLGSDFDSFLGNYL